MTDRSHFRDAGARDARVLGALEAELGLADVAPPAGRSAPAEDLRLAELARIVGQDDRFRDLLRTPAQVVPGHEPGGGPVNSPEGAARLDVYSSSAQYGDAPTAGAHDPYGDPWGAQPVDAHAGSAHDAGLYAHDVMAHGGAPHDLYHQEVAAGAPYSHGGVGPAAPDPLMALEGGRLRRRPSRRPLYAAVAVVALCVSASAGWYALQGAVEGDSGEAPTIHADAGPVKVRPPAENAAEPAATKEIYEQLAGPPGDTKVVASNEQPVDVEQTLRQQRAAAIASGRLPSEMGGEAGSYGAPGVAPLAVPGAHRDPREGLGEPRRVRTVSIRPDGTVRESGAAASTAAEIARPAEPALAQAAAAPAKIDERAPQSGVDATTTGSVGHADAPPPPPAAKPAAAASGGFAVQLGAPGSEAEARRLATNLKRKYNALQGFDTAVIRAQSNGRTVYRLRVPGLSRESAVNLCQQLKSVGGSCFVAQG